MTAPGGAKVLVTGAGGLVGRAVAARLLADGASVTAVTRDATVAPTTVALDLARAPWPAGEWNAIVHCAARLPMRFEGPEADAASAENRAMDDRALDAAATSGAHLVYFSTGAVYGTAIGEISEATPAAPTLSYAREKLTTEFAITTRGLPATILRLVAPYGPRQQRATVLRRFLDQALTGAPLRYYGTGTRSQDFLHVDDVATAAALAARSRTAGCFLLASGSAITMRDLARLVVQATGSSSVVEAAGNPDPEEGRTIRYRVERIAGQLGFTPQVTLAQGIAEWAAVRRGELAAGAAP